MRAHVLTALTGALGMAAVVASAPQLLSSPDDCIAPSTATVLVTAEPSTIYVTIPVSSIEVNLSEAPTSTLTRFATLYSTTTTPQTFTEYLSAAQTSSGAGQFDPSSPYDPTITETAVVTITNVNLTPLPSGGSLTYTETPAPNGLLNYVVENGTTYWLDGQTPAPGGTYVYSTSSITVVPVYASASSSEQVTSILAMQSTLYVTQQFTLTETLEPALSSSTSQGAIASAGTGLPYSKSHGGWNATKTDSGGIYSGATNVVSASSAGGVLATGSPTLALYSSFNIYESSHTTISKSTLVAASGFYAFTTPISGYSNVTSAPSDPGSITSSASGQETTAFINGVTVSWGGSSGIAGQYSNSTLATSIRVTNAASGVLTSLSSSSSGFVLRSSSSTEDKTSTDTCIETPYSQVSTSAPHINSTFATLVRSTGTASGALTSLSSSSSGVAVSLPSISFNNTTYTSSVKVLPFLSSLLSTGSYSYSTLAKSTASSSALVVSISANTSTSVTSNSSTSQPVYQSSSALPTSSYIASTSAPAYTSSLTPSSTSSSKTSTYASSSASASPSNCGEYGDFTLNFDDIPPLSIGNQSASSVQPEPVFNPYHQFDFSDGFTVVPPPTDPYRPSSPPLLLEFIPNFNINGTNPQAGPNTAEEGYSGQISDGDFDQTGCFRFNMYGAKFGCDSTGLPCNFTFTGYELDASRNEVQVAAQKVSIVACPALTNCDLLPINLDTTFKNLAFVRINVTVDNEPKIWWMDDLRLGWFNNSCTTGLCRQTTHLH